jgi:hypothetical protein
MKKDSITKARPNKADKTVDTRSVSSVTFWRRPCGLQRIKCHLQYGAAVNHVKKQGENV